MQQKLSKTGKAASVRKSVRRVTAARMRGWMGATTLLGVSVLLSGCHIDQWNQPKIKPYFESEFYADDAGSRTLVQHTVPVGPVEADDPAYFTGYVAGKPVKVMPVKAVNDFASPKEMLLRGQDRFNAYCSPCHGRTGNGNGFIMQRGLGYWQKLAASYHTDRLRKIEDGYIYDVLVNGHGVMYGYGERIKSPDDRWAIVAYVRALQLTEGAAGGTAAGAATTLQAPALNTAPADGQPTAAEQPGLRMPINRTAGGDTETRPDQPGVTSTTPATPAPAVPVAPAAGEKTTP